MFFGDPKISAHWIVNSVRRPGGVRNGVSRRADSSPVTSSTSPRIAAAIFKSGNCGLRPGRLPPAPRLDRILHRLGERSVAIPELDPHKVVSRNIVEGEYQVRFSVSVQIGECYGPYGGRGRLVNYSERPAW